MNADHSGLEPTDEAIKKAEDETDAQAMKDALKELEDGKTVSLDKLRAELGIKRD